MAKLNAAEQAAIQKLEEEYPGHEVTINQFGAAELRPLSPEELAKREQSRRFAMRAEVLGVFDAA